MAIEPSFEEQQLLAETFRREESRLTRREAAAEFIVGGGFVVAVAGLWVAWPPGSFSVAPAIICVAVLALATKVRLDTPLGFTVATQLAFVPLLFALPVALVPIAVCIGLAFAQLLNVRSGRANVRALCLTIGNSWFAIGPVAVFTMAHTEPAHASALLLLAALAAQFAVDFAVSTLRFAIRRGATASSQLRETWVYAVDAALSPVGLLAALAIGSRSLAALSLVPLILLLTTFARERHERLRSLLELNTAYRGTAMVLGDVVEADDGYTGHHSRSVVGLALSVADKLGLAPERRRNVEFAALLHDVGKITIPKEIINKPTALDPHEWLIVKTHTIGGQRMLDRIGGFMHDVGRIVRSHHERWDGDGYPDGISGDEIPLESRIITCCDTWNAMRTDRGYRKALPYELALTELEAAAGTQLDPNLVPILVRIVASPTAAEADSAENSVHR